MAKKTITILLIILSCLCSCKEEKRNIYTITDKEGQKNIVSYGTIVCDEIITVSAPQNCDNYVKLCYAGQHITAGDSLAQYTHNGSKTEIKAKSNGVICDKHLVSENEISYYNTDCAIITTLIPEKDIKFIEKGNKVVIEGEGLVKSSYFGTVNSISSTAKSNENGTFIECEISFDNPDKSILPGFSVKIKYQATVENSVVIPINTINYDSRGYYVTTVTDSKTTKKYVKDIMFNDGEYTVCSGLKSGDKLIIYD